MSTFVDKAVNPKTCKFQAAIFIDDFYGQHLYGVAFKKDGSDATFEEITTRIDRSKYFIYPIESVKMPANDNKSVNEKRDATS